MNGLIYIKSYSAPKINKKEILRYAGAKNNNDETESLLDCCIEESEPLFSYKVCYRRFSACLTEDKIDLGFAKVNSHSLALCLRDCEEIIVFCATVGVNIDRLILKYSIASPAKAIMLQAFGSERVEALCDAFCDDIGRELKAKLRPRFSPGYGDLPLEIQKDIFACLQPQKIGVSLGENLFMTPSKTVTAIIGIKNEK